MLNVFVCLVFFEISFVALNVRRHILWQRHPKKKILKQNSQF